MDAIAGDNDSSRNAAYRNPQEPSRTSWAEVVSGGRNEEAEEKPEGDYGPRRNRRNSRIEETAEIGNDGNWEVVGGKQQQEPPARSPYKHKVAAEAWRGYKRPANEQNYVDDATHGLDTEPTTEELEDLSKACNRLWDLDINRLEPGKDYQIDCGEGKKVYQKGDMASASLFSWLSDDTFRRPTYSRFCSLLNNYNPNEGVREVVTAEEKNEQAAFIEEIGRTAPIKYLHRYLVSKDIVSSNYEDFKEMLSHLWFDLHGRGGGSSCSSAFEHVFVGEIKGRREAEVSGFHNWIQFYLEEAKGRVEYQGYIFPRRHGQSVSASGVLLDNCLPFHQPDSETQFLTVQFEWNGVLKSVSSTLVGVSPEFEIALLTLCFFVGDEDNFVSLGPYSVNVKCYRLGNNRIGSAFPIAEC